MSQFDWLCDVCGCVMSPTSGIYWVELGFINNYKRPQQWLVLLRYSADVASAFPWVVTLSFFIPSPCAKGPLAFVQTNRPPTKIILSNKRWLCILIILFYNIILSLFFKINKCLLVCVSYLNLLCQL